jgi:capsular polysaccharide transport system permease protein
MIQQIIKQSPLARLSARIVAWAQNFLVPAALRRRLFAATLLLNLLAGIYWGVIASDRYVSEAHVIVQRTDMAAGASSDFAGLLSGLGGGSNHADQMLLRDYLLSPEVLRKLDARLKLRQHFSDDRYDALSRMSAGDESIEKFLSYYRKRVSVNLDDYSGVLVVRAQAFEPVMAQAIVQVMLEEGERHLNELGHQLAREQVKFLEQQVADTSARALAARQEVIRYQNEKGLVSPQSEIETRAGIAASLLARQAELNTRRAAMLAYLMPDSPRIQELDAQISALERQINTEKGNLAAPGGNTLNATVEEYQRLTMAAEFAGALHKTTLTALERGRVEAMRLLKKVSVTQSASLPEYPLQPRRGYNFIVFLIVSMLVSGILHLIAAIIRDHKD